MVCLVAQEPSLYLCWRWIIVQKLLYHDDDVHNSVLAIRRLIDWRWLGIGFVKDFRSTEYVAWQ